jgi:hypothetical protein
MKACQPKWELIEGPRQMRALVQVLDTHTLAAPRELSAELPHGSRSADAALRVEDGQDYWIGSLLLLGAGRRSRGEGGHHDLDDTR